MRVLFLTSAFEGVAGYWRAFYLAKYLALKKHDVILVVQGRSNRVVTKFVDNVKMIILPTFQSSEKFSKMRMGIATPFQTVINALFTISMKSDVIHVFDALFPQNAVSVIISKLMHKKKRPLIFVDWDDWWGRGGILDVFHKDLNFLTRRFLTFLEESVPFYSDAVTVTCETLRKRAVSRGVKPERIFLLPNGTEIGYDENRIEIQEARRLVGLPSKVIIYACSKSSFDWINPYDDPLWDLLDAHKKVIETYPQATLMFLGKGSEKCMRTAKKYGVNKNIISMDFQPKDKYSLYLAASNFLLIPLRKYNTSFDNSRFPLRLLDYMALGKPVIATDLFEIKKMINGCGLLTEPNDSKDLANKIIEMIENLDLWASKAKEKQEEIIRNYSWRNIAEQLEKYYYKVYDSNINHG